MTGEGSSVDEWQGRLSGRGRRVAVVVARFNREFTRMLRDRTVATLLEHGVDADGIEEFEVPGAWELPQAAQRALATDRFDAVVAIGCVIRGETPHFEYIAGEAARGLAEAGRSGGRPVVFGVLTTDSRAQAEARAAPDGLDKGREAALTALRMIEVLEQIDRGAS